VTFRSRATGGIEYLEALRRIADAVLEFTEDVDKPHRRTPCAAAAMLTVGIIALGPVSGGAFNPVRGLAPDVLAGVYPAVWVYITGPLLGAALAAEAFIAARGRPVTGKLRHDPAIPSYMRYDLHLMEDKIADAEIRAVRRRRGRAAR
jgi:Major intrinsic protein